MEFPDFISKVSNEQLESIGKWKGLHKTYVTSNGHEWKIESYNVFKWLIRKVFGGYKSSHYKVVSSHLKERIKGLDLTKLDDKTSKNLEFLKGKMLPKVDQDQLSTPKSAVPNSPVPKSAVEGTKIISGDLVKQKVTKDISFYLTFYGQKVNETLFKEALIESLKKQGEMLREPDVTNESCSIYYQKGLDIDKIKKDLEEKFGLRMTLFPLGGVQGFLPDWAKGNAENVELAVPPKSVEELKPSMSMDSVLEKIVEDDSIKYLILGEGHGEEAANNFLDRYKTELANGGYEMLGLEFFNSSMQIGLDAYHFKLQENLPKRPPSRVRHPFKKRELAIPAMNEVGIRPIGLENNYTMGLTRDSSDRLDGMNLVAVDVIDKEVVQSQKAGEILSRNPKGKGKMIIWVGAGHAEGIASYLGRSNCAIIGVKDAEAEGGNRVRIRENLFRAEDGAERFPMDVIFEIEKNKPS